MTKKTHVEICRKYRQNHRESVRIQSCKDSKKIRQNSDWRIYYNKLSEKRRLRLKLVTPVWSETEKIKIVYDKCHQLKKQWSVDLTVDHIIPIFGKNVTGLHVWSNLQILHRSLNSSKGINSLSN